MNFDEQAKTWDDDPAKVERSRRVAELLRRHLPLTGTEHVLDIGAGTGSLSLNLADAVGRITLTDPSAGMMQVASERIAEAGLGDRLEARVLDLTQQFPNERFDGAWSQMAFHHVPDIDLLLRRCHAVLDPGGWLAIVDLDADDHGHFHQHIREHHPEHGHEGHFVVHDGFDRAELACQAEAAGFTRVELFDAGVVGKEVDGQMQDFPMFLAVAYA